jgi:alkylation response protein AidB-like acyl-CoA dehydrogenase
MTATLASHPAIAEQVAQLAAAWRSTAVARDRAGGHAAAERAMIRESGLLDLSVPVAQGGRGVAWTVFYDALRTLAQADSALAHVFAFHHLQVATLLLYGDAAQQARWLRRTVEERLFWGNALNPNDRRTAATRTAAGYRLDGPKSFCSGSVGADALTLTAWHEPTQSLLIGVLPAQAPGVTVEEDWDAFGQRQTDSGTVRFDAVLLPEADVLVPPGAVPTVRGTLRAQFAQLILATLYLGIAEGAFDEARRFVREVARPAPAAQAGGVARAGDDPYVQQRVAELHLLVRPAALLVAEAAGRLDAAFQRGEALTAGQRGEVAIAVAEAKVLAHRAAVEVGSKLFEVTGARSTSQRFGLDRFWRNARVHTLHDPVDYKLRDLGRYLLDGRHPDPTPYS